MRKLLLLSFITLVVASCGKKYPNDTLADTGRTQRTENLLANMMAQADSAGYMFGHQDDTAYGVGWVYNGEKSENGEVRSDVKSVCNDYPAVMGFDLGHLEIGDSVNLDGVPFDDMRQMIIDQFDRGGVVTLSWHLDNPLTGGSAWVKPDSLTDQEKHTVASVLPGGEKHEVFLGWLDRVADFISSLETPYGVRVPVIFRPWHEHTGSWFWWGENVCSKEEYIALWKFTADRLKEKKVVNALFAYSPGSDPQPNEQHYMDRYPGDDIIDMLGVDIYCYVPEGDTTAVNKYSENLAGHLAFMQKLGKEHHKPFAVTETGFEGIPMDNWWTSALAPSLNKYGVGYVLVWRNAHDKQGHFYAPYPGQRSTKDFVQFYNDTRALFLHDINGIYLEK